MINLLSSKEKLVLIEEENQKLILILGTILFLALLCFALILLSIKIHISGELETQKIFLEQKKLDSSSIQEVEQEIKHQNLSFLELKTFYEKDFRKSEILEMVSQKLPPNTYLTNFRLSTVMLKEKENELSISLSGFSPDRDVLMEFQKNLESEDMFQEIDFPASCWVKPNDIDFLVSFKVQLE